MPRNFHQPRSAGAKHASCGFVRDYEDYGRPTNGVGIHGAVGAVRNGAGIQAGEEAQGGNAL